MNKELAQKLKDAGFPWREGDWYTSDGQWLKEDERYWEPSLSELIEAIGGYAFQLHRHFDIVSEGFVWSVGVNTSEALQEGRIVEGCASPEEAVAKLYIKIHGKKAE